MEGMDPNGGGDMMMLLANKQKLWYSLYEGEVPEYALDEWGNPVIDVIKGKEVPRKTGATVLKYSPPSLFWGDIQNAGGEAEAVSFGVSVGDYDAVLYMMAGELPLDETSLIWFQTAPGVLPDGGADPETADYTVKRVPVHLNQVAYLLARNIR